MAFEIFKEVGARTREYISITENKVFGLPRPFINKQGITNDHKAVLLYDEEAKKIALCFTTQAVKYGIKVRIPNSTQGGIVAAGSFFDLKGIDVTKYARRYDFDKQPLRELGIDSDGEAYVITLTEQVKPAEKSDVITEQPVIDESEELINIDDIPF